MKGYPSLATALELKRMVVYLPRLLAIYWNMIKLGVKPQDARLFIRKTFLMRSHLGNMSLLPSGSRQLIRHMGNFFISGTKILHNRKLVGLLPKGKVDRIPVSHHDGIIRAARESTEKRKRLSKYSKSIFFRGEMLFVIAPDTLLSMVASLSEILQKHTEYKKFFWVVGAKKIPFVGVARMIPFGAFVPDPKKNKFNKKTRVLVLSKGLLRFVETKGIGSKTTLVCQVQLKANSKRATNKNCLQTIYKNANCKGCSLSIFALPQMNFREFIRGLESVRDTRGYLPRLVLWTKM